MVNFVVLTYRDTEWRGDPVLCEGYSPFAIRRSWSQRDFRLSTDFSIVNRSTNFYRFIGNFRIKRYLYKNGEEEVGRII